MKGLSGQLWIGSGFGEDSRGWIGVTGQPEGELGCSDVPGWEETYAKFGSAKADGTVKKPFAAKTGAEDMDVSSIDQERRTMKGGVKKKTKKLPKPAVQEDGTDNYLFQSDDAPADSDKIQENADIQSLQESAEITGKIVLLSRGGCGFLDKAKWTQRRGGIALIVGDNVPGGPLVTMYARGDTSNVTIAALFTSHTTAHLLSSLIPLKNGGSLATSVSASNKNAKSLSGKAPNFPGYKETTASTDGTKSLDHSSNLHSSSTNIESAGFFKKVFALFGLVGKDARPNARPHQRRDGDWVLVDDWETPATPLKDTGDFVIGVQDWRDPDLTKKPSTAQGAREQGDAPKTYRRYTESETSSSNRGNTREKPTDEGYMNKAVKNEFEEDQTAARGKLDGNPSTKSELGFVEIEVLKPGRAENAEETPKVPHEGLWVTLTPTDMSSNPFFDTILVLVISPLITLTLVYAVLLVRSRIRRRRWRAPKSVVDKLPVRTYHTMASSGASSTALATPHASSPNTPLLQQGRTELGPSLSRSQSRTRPRSRTTSEVPGPSSYISDDDDFISLTESDRREKGLAEWRRRYGGRQKECVVCLEEYIDGVSRLMSLPCGHEFHVECITPWLTTRRRTCPICKGDVVRSITRQDDRLHRRRPSSLPFNSSDDGEDILQARVATTRNDSPSANEPIHDEDLERAGTSDAEESQSVLGLVSEWWQRISGSSGAGQDRRRTRGRSRRAERDPDRDR